GGDVIKLVQLKERLDFKYACEWLEGRSASPPSEWKVASQPVRSSPTWERLTLPLQTLLNRAALVYVHALWRHRDALAYVQRRGIPEHVIRECALGYCDGHSFAESLRSDEDRQLAEELGLIWPREKDKEHAQPRERLTGRIVVPELRWGLPVWLIGRSLRTARSSRTADLAYGSEPAGRRPPPKYLALPGQRPILGLERAVGASEVVLCEGVFDYLTALSWGLAACCVSGTSLPADRFGFLAKAELVHVVFDGDVAGNEAASRFAVELGDRLRPLPLPDGCDLNDLGCRPGGHAFFFQLLEQNRRAHRERVWTAERNHDHAISH
ncbi:MAG TPA: toprim domain-containing protein, partial [Chloroflexota bacterium]|nr:toprim domain-containing protein [Chloroflexota bacterium]